MPAASLVRGSCRFLLSCSEADVPDHRHDLGTTAVDVGHLAGAVVDCAGFFLYATV